MRVLCSTTAGAGHFGPMVPFAHACREAGHEVLVAAPESFAAAVSGAGLPHAPFDDVPPDVMGAVFARLPTLPREEANAVVIGEVFGRLDPQAAMPRLRAVVEDWRPHVVLREAAEVASLVAADAAGVPQVQVSIGMTLGPEFFHPLRAPLDELDALAGLRPGRAMELVTTTPSFSTVPESVDLAGASGGEGEVRAEGPVWRFHDPGLAGGPGGLPGTWGDPAWPLVYVTFGSVSAGLTPFAGVYAAALEALRDLPVRVLMTTGGDVEIEDVPANARVERWWPQADVMPHAAAVVGHGGFGTTMAALAAGVPQVVVPLFAFDQFVNARRVAAVGAGIEVLGGPSALPGLAAAVARVLGERDLADGARAVAADIAALPPVATAVPLLEQLAAAAG